MGMRCSKFELVPFIYREDWFSEDVQERMVKPLSTKEKFQILFRLNGARGMRRELTFHEFTERLGEKIFPTIMEFNIPEGSKVEGLATIKEEPFIVLCVSDDFYRRMEQVYQRKICLISTEKEPWTPPDKDVLSRSLGIWFFRGERREVFI